MFVAGAAIQWLRDQLRLIDTSADSEYFATKVEDNGGVYFVPALQVLVLHIGICMQEELYLG